MRRSRQPGEAKQPLLLACLLAAAMFPAGCNTTNKAKSDPLFGVNPPGGNPASSPPAAVPRTKNEASAAPTSIGGNLAWLATLPDSRPLAISQPETAPAAGTANTALASTAKNPPGASLSAPVPVVQPVPRAGEDPVVPASSWDKAQLTAPATTTAAPSQVPTVAAGVSVPAPPTVAPAATQQQPAPAEDPLLTQLRARGISWQKAENVAGGVKFSCLVPNRHNPEVTRMYEAIGPDYPAAVRAVLWKVDQDQK